MLNLDSLPLELKFEIYSHLARPLSSHKGISVPVNYDEQKHIERLRCDRVQLMQHPYCQMAATCESLRDSVEAYCLHLIKGQTNPKTKQGRTKIPKSPKDDWRSTIAKANAKGARPKNVVKLPKPTEACRNLYLRSVFKKCIFCGGGTTRRAAFNRFMWCCMNCDIEQYGRLIVSWCINLHCGIRNNNIFTEQDRSLHETPSPRDPLAEPADRLPGVHLATSPHGPL